VDIPASLSGDGKRHKRFFTDPVEAEKYAKTLRTAYHSGLRGVSIPPALAQMAAEAEALLEPYGVTIMEAARSFVVRQATKSGSREPFQELYNRFTDAQQEHWRPRYKSDMDKIPRWVGKAFMATPVGDITDEMLRLALIKHGASAESTQDMRRARVKAVLGGKGNKPKASNIFIMSMKQAGRALRSCVTPEERRATAMLLFGGVRPDAQDGEITRLEWEAVGEEEIYISPEVSKTRTDRHIPITPRLERLIADRPAKGPVMPARWKLSYQRIRRACGLTTEQDAMRHTFASHFLAVFGEDATKAAMGHVPNSATLFRHYRRSVTRKQGLAYFGIKDALALVATQPVDKRAAV
jgi:integrase